MGNETQQKRSSLGSQKKTLLGKGQQEGGENERRLILPLDLEAVGPKLLRSRLRTPRFRLRDGGGNQKLRNGREDFSLGQHRKEGRVLLFLVRGPGGEATAYLDHPQEPPSLRTGGDNRKTRGEKVGRQGITKKITSWVDIM